MRRPDLFTKFTSMIWQTTITRNWPTSTWNKTRWWMKMRRSKNQEALLQQMSFVNNFGKLPRIMFVLDQLPHDDSLLTQYWSKGAWKYGSHWCIMAWWRRLWRRGQGPHQGRVIDIEETKTRPARTSARLWQSRGLSSFLSPLKPLTTIGHYSATQANDWGCPWANQNAIVGNGRKQVAKCGDRPICCWYSGYGAQ
jgi:hypothetical protein